MTIVSNTSPISNLAKVGHIDLLQKLYKTVLIPTAVYDELLDERAGETIIKAVRSANWLEVQLVQNQKLVGELQNILNLGEAEVIALAVEVIEALCFAFFSSPTVNGKGISELIMRYY